MMNSRWVSEAEWACMKHVPSMYMPASLSHCLLCTAIRPPAMPVKVRVVSSDLHKPQEEEACVFIGCMHPSRSNSKYCSRACSNKNARKRHKERKSK